MTRGMRNGSDEFAKAYIHGRIDATRELLIAKVDKRLDRELTQWCFRFALNPLELKQELGAVSVAAQAHSLPSSGVQYATGQQEGHVVAALEMAERAHGVRSSHGPRGGDSQDAPHQVGAAPASDRKVGIAAYWAAMSPQQKAALMRDKLLATAKKRMLSPMEKKRLKTFKVNAGDAVAPRAAKKEAKPPRTLTEAERIAKQRIYAARSAAKAKGLPLPPLPKEEHQETTAA